MRLEPLSSEALQTSIKNVMNSDCWSVVLTFIDGDLLFGDLAYLPRVFSGTPEEAEKVNMWLPEKWRSVSSDWRCAYKLRPIFLVFNSKEGTKHGRAHEIVINDEIISGIRPLSWTEESVSSLTLKNVPNPIATLICEHNFRVAAKYDLHISEFIECALSESGIPPGGIEFKNDEIIYVDWEFFSHISGGSLFAGAYGMGVSMQRSLYQLAHDKITNGVIEKIAKILPIGKPIETCRVSGFLVMPSQEITTIIEGGECKVVICSDKKCFPPEKTFIPVLLKKKSISYPPEFLRFLNSGLVFYGEIKQIPIEIDGAKSDVTLLARAIGYIATK